MRCSSAVAVDKDEVQHSMSHVFQLAEGFCACGTISRQNESNKKYDSMYQVGAGQIVHALYVSFAMWCSCGLEPQRGKFQEIILQKLTSLLHLRRY